MKSKVLKVTYSLEDIDRTNMFACVCTAEVGRTNARRDLADVAHILKKIALTYALYIRHTNACPFNEVLF